MIFSENSYLSGRAGKTMRSNFGYFRRLLSGCS